LSLHVLYLLSYILRVKGIKISIEGVPENTRILYAGNSV